MLNSSTSCKLLDVAYRAQFSGFLLPPYLSSCPFICWSQSKPSLLLVYDYKSRVLVPVPQRCFSSINSLQLQQCIILITVFSICLASNLQIRVEAHINRGAFLLYSCSCGILSKLELALQLLYSTDDCVSKKVCPQIGSNTKIIFVVMRTSFSNF